MAAAGALALGAALSVLTACTSANPGGRATTPSTTPVASSSSAPTTTALPSSSPHRTRSRHPHSSPATTTAAPSTTTAASTTTAPPTTAPVTSPSSSPSPSTCRKLTIRLIRGGAAEGTEIAALQFQNSGHKTCDLGGFPQVVLLRNGTQIGSPSQPQSGASARTVRLAPGQTTQSLLRDYSSCQAPLSDNARVTVPGETMSVVRPAELRACTLRVGALGNPR